MAIGGGLRKLQPQHADLTQAIPSGARPIGLTPDGTRQLFRLRRERSRPVPDIDPATGEVKKQKHAITGQPLYSIYKHEHYVETIDFYLESEGNFNVRMIPWLPPSPEEVATAERERRLREARAALDEALADAEIDPKALIAFLRRARPDEAEELAPANEDGETADLAYPVHLGFGNWQLSDGSMVKGKKDKAIEAESKVSDDARAATAARRAATASAPEL